MVGVSAEATAADAPFCRGDEAPAPGEDEAGGGADIAGWADISNHADEARPPPPLPHLPRSLLPPTCLQATAEAVYPRGRGSAGKKSNREFERADVGLDQDDVPALARKQRNRDSGNRSRKKMQRNLNTGDAQLDECACCKPELQREGTIHPVPAIVACL